ncbi:ribonuclease HII [candidate division KSB1 bacterium]
MTKTYKYIIGIDEVGRGPIAGPVSVGAVLLPKDYSWQNFDGLKDSKKLTEKNREVWFSKVCEMSDVSYAVSSVSEKIIDSGGIVPAIRTALSQSLKKLDVEPNECLVLLDGGLYAPEEFIYQKTIIKGDEKECAIALASVMAKVTRDRKMVQFGGEYSEYGFETHKGYGTKKHYEKIREHGLCDIHRRSFLKSL